MKMRLHKKLSRLMRRKVRVSVLSSHGIEPVNRTKARKGGFENFFVEHIFEKTNGQGISIFVDNIGAPVHRMTLKVLARQAVVTTSGWKSGMNILLSRAIECINRRTYVHTHYARYEEGLEAMDFAVRNNWMPPVDKKIWSWDEIPLLVEQYASMSLSTYFPLFSVNSLERNHDVQ